jgi:dehydrogenase/reductase SDR family protein 4
MDKMYEVNFRGAFSLVKESLPLMQGRKGANIILMSSYAAYEPDPTIGFYSITKTMLVVMAKILSKELASSGVRVNAICPGLIKTKLSKALWDGREEEVISHLGISRLGRTDDISSAVAYVASEEAEFLTGKDELSI